MADQFYDDLPNLGMGIFHMMCIYIYIQYVHRLGARLLGFLMVVVTDENGELFPGNDVGTTIYD